MIKSANKLAEFNSAKQQTPESVVHLLEIIAACAVSCKN